jgi:hypothetical protein
MMRADRRERRGRTTFSPALPAANPAPPNPHPQWRIAVTDKLVERVASGSLDANGIMIRAAAVLGAHPAEQGWKPYMTWNTEARRRAYSDAYYNAKRLRRSKG